MMMMMMMMKPTTDLLVLTTHSHIPVSCRPSSDALLPERTLRSPAFHPIALRAIGRVHVVQITGITNQSEYIGQDEGVPGT